MVIEPLSTAYEATQIGYDNWVSPSPDQTLDDFQLVVVAAESLQAIRRIKIMELRQELCSGQAVINAVRFRRLR